MLEVVEPGLLTTVQDWGRPRAVAMGVPIGGACDRWGLAVANSILGNGEAAPALEMTLSGATLRALRDCLVGVGGAEMGGRVIETGVAVPTGSAALLRADQTLAFEAPGDGGGARTYLAVPGGVDVPEVLGSRSTCLIGGFGGLDGRALRVGDVIRPRGSAAAPRPAGPPAAARASVGRMLRVVRGPHASVLGERVLATLLEQEWQVSAHGDRQGIRLDGPQIQAVPDKPLLSHGVAWGAVQLPPDGRPIALLADHQTVGGYPVIAVVVSADLSLLGQLAPGDAVRFLEVSLADARAAALQWRRALDALMAHASPR